MGERAARLEEATDEDAQAMRRLAAEAMRAGAIGFSTSRTLNHRTATGDPTPSLRATAHELEMIVAGVADAGSGVIELISDFSPDLDGEFDMIRDLVAHSGRPTLHVAGAEPPSPRGLARPARPDRGGGGRRDCPSGPRWRPARWDVLLGLQSSFHPFSGHPAYRVDRRAAPGRAGARPAGSRPSGRRLVAEAPPGGRRLIDYERMFPLGEPPDYEPPRERSLAALAAARGVGPRRAGPRPPAGGRRPHFLFAPFSNYADCNLDACGEMMVHPDTVFGLGDGGAHVGLISDASFPTYALAHWGRDRGQGPPARRRGWSSS